MYKNIEKQAKIMLKDQVEYQKGQVVSKTLVQNDYVSMTIFSFDKGEEISTHAAGGDA
ncbi:MAG: cupin domain-containing protein, partial [Pseudobutyrivibrio sp.]|nr:cupin domain-containing protein [Pseudobutyrivibrio sp.]